MKLPGVEDKELIQPQEPKVKQRHLGLDEDFRVLGFWRMQKNHRNTPEVRRLPELCNKLMRFMWIFSQSIYIGSFLRWRNCHSALKGTMRIDTITMLASQMKFKRSAKYSRRLCPGGWARLDTLVLPESSWDHCRTPFKSIPANHNICALFEVHSHGLPLFSCWNTTNIPPSFGCCFRVN